MAAQYSLLYFFGTLILAIFITTMLFYPHWLFVVLGIPGALVLYMSCQEEETYLVRKFGEEYLDYIQRVPRMNIIAGLLRLFSAWRGKILG